MVFCTVRSAVLFERMRIPYVQYCDVRTLDFSCAREVKRVMHTFISSHLQSASSLHTVFAKGESASSLHVQSASSLDVCCRARGRYMHFLLKGRAHRRYMCMFCAERFVATCLFIAICMHILIIPCMRTLGSNCVFLLASPPCCKESCPT